MDGNYPHHQVVIAGAGISGLTALIQLKRKLSLEHVVVYEKGTQLGGTWATNSYPGATSDIPISFYSASFSPATQFDTQWPTSQQILHYWKTLAFKYSVSSSIVYSTLIAEATFSRQTGVWELVVVDVATGNRRMETCNVFVSAVGALSVPADAPFDTNKFEGKVVHTGNWDDELDLDRKNVVVLGNGCSAAQFIPAVIDRVNNLTQVARSKHSIVPPVQVPDNYWTNLSLRWIPGVSLDDLLNFSSLSLFTVFRCLVFYLCESYFWLNQDTDKAKKGRQNMKKISNRYIEKTAPEKYWGQLKYDFEFGQKRRIIDFQHYTRALHSPKMNLLQPDTIASVSGKTVTTQRGVVIRDVDVIVLSTGFKVTDYLFPLKIYNGDGEDLVKRLKASGIKTYLTSMVAGFPNFFMLMGPNSVTGHSSVLFNTECTVDMMIELVRPVFAALAEPESVVSETVTVLDEKATPYNTEFSTSPFDEKFPFHRNAEENESGPSIPTFPIASRAPSVEVSQRAEDEWYAAMREEMDKKIWEKKDKSGKVSWYTDSEQGGKCTTLYPWSQVHFKKSTQNIIKERFIWSNC